MQGYTRRDIAKEEIVPVARRMREQGIYLVMIHGLLDKNGTPDISYEYAVGPDIESYHVTGETEFPSICDIYDSAAEWPERELNELFGWKFEGLDTSKRLFLPEDMLEEQGRGQIMVKSLKELREINIENSETVSAAKSGNAAAGNGPESQPEKSE